MKFEARYAYGEKLYGYSQKHAVKLHTLNCDRGYKEGESTKKF